jgi:protein-disulfide isomerase
LLEQYPGKVKLIFKNYPLAYHAFSRKAALAAAAAQIQGRFWEYHDLIFENHQHLDDQKFLEIARQLNLDMKKFEKDMNDPATSLRVDKDVQLGRSVGVRGTPTIFINGSIAKARTLEDFKAIVAKELKKTGKRADLSGGQVRQ